jgi:hypothetical protein
MIFPNYAVTRIFLNSADAIHLAAKSFISGVCCYALNYVFWYQTFVCTLFLYL